MVREDIEACPMGRIEMGDRQVQMITLLPYSIVHYRIFTAETPEGLNIAINDFGAKLSLAGGHMYQTSCLSETPLIYLVIYHHLKELEIHIE